MVTSDLAGAGVHKNLRILIHVKNRRGHLARYLLITRRMDAKLSLDSALQNTNPNGVTAMAKHKKQSSKVQKRKGAKARPRAKKLSKAARGKAAAKRAVANAKPKHAPVKEAVRLAAPAVETVVVEVVEQPAPDVITVTEVEETEVRKAS